MKKGILGASIAMVLMLVGVSQDALAQRSSAMFATTAEKCADPSPMTDGLAVFATKIVGLEWSCSSSRSLALGGRSVDFKCNAEGEEYTVPYQLVGTQEAAYLVKSGDVANGTRLLDCSTARAASAPSRGGSSSAGAQVSEIRGELSRRDARLPSDGSFYQDYTIQLERGERVQIVLTSPDFDAYLLVSGHGIELQDDDSGGGTHAMISFVAPRTGDYVVSVNTYAAGETGAFVLRATTTR